MQEGAIGEALLVLAAPVAAFVWMAWRRRELDFWFPQERAVRERPVQSLAPSRNWRTLTAFAVYLIVWYAVLVGAA